MQKLTKKVGRKKKTEIITYYNKHKIGVDMVDKMCSGYNVQRGTRRWPMVIFFTMLNVSGINSQIIYLGNGNEVPPRRVFLQELGSELIRDQLIRRSSLTHLPRTITLRISEILPKYQISTPSSTKLAVADESKRKRCHPCWENKFTRLTKYTCKECGQYLCLQHCGIVCPEGCNIDGNDEDDEDSE